MRHDMNTLKQTLLITLLTLFHIPLYGSAKSRILKTLLAGTTAYAGYKIFYPEKKEYIKIISLDPSLTPDQQKETEETIQLVNDFFNANAPAIERNYMASQYVITLIIKITGFQIPWPIDPEGGNQADFEARCNQKLEEEARKAQAYLSKNHHDRDFQKNIGEWLAITYDNIQKTEGPGFLSDEKKKQIENYVAQELKITLQQLRWDMYKTREWIRERDTR
jgi:hypothetical protein